MTDTKQWINYVEPALIHNMRLVQTALIQCPCILIGDLKTHKLKAILGGGSDGGLLNQLFFFNLSID